MRRPLTAARVAIVIAALGLAVSGLVGFAGYQFARERDAQFAAERRVALQAAVGEFRALFGNGSEIDPRFLRMIAQSAGVKDVTFGAAPLPGRDMQPVVNAQGRILGFLTWQAEAPTMETMQRLLPLFAGGVFGIFGIAGFAAWRLRRSSAEADEQETVRAGQIAPPLTPEAVEPPRLETVEQQFIRRELPRAISADSFDVHYQPIVASAGGRVTGVEALLRWTHPDRGPISPALFVPVAEQMGLMDELGGFVLRRAVEDAKRWPDVYMSVNLSPLQVRDRGIVQLVREVLHEAAVAPSRLLLEITEGVLIDNPEQMLRRIEELRAIGVRIALDDFGSGYSSLGYLQRFAFDKLKIDRSFVTALGRSPNAAVIVQAIVALGRALGVTVLVEGVETEEQRVLLRLAGCDEMQGFLFARPAPASAIDALIAARSARTAA
jgi:EAL domain-containing protein (putative c-di-GMP-specific phosphodiesterase class I)